MKNTGRLLKEKRESLNLTISEVALATKISPKILNAMEAGDFQNLPAHTFLKGFVRSYANFLRLDVDAVLVTFAEELAAHVAEPPKEQVSETVSRSSMPPTPRVRRVEEESNTTAKTVAVLAIVVLIGLIVGVRELIDKYQKEKVVEQAQNLNATPLPTTVTATEAVTEEKAGEPSVPVDPTAMAQAATTASEANATSVVSTPPAAEPAKAEPAVVPSESKGEEKADLKAESQVEAKPEIKKAEAKAEVKGTVASPVEEAAKRLGEIQIGDAQPEQAAKLEEVAPATVTPKDSGQPAAVDPKVELKKAKEEEKKAASNKKKKKNEIILEALDRVDVKVDIKGRMKRLSLAPTQVHTIRSDGPVQMDISDGGAVSIIVNGEERGVPGDLGKPKQVKIP